MPALFRIPNIFLFASCFVWGNSCNKQVANLEFAVVFIEGIWSKNREFCSILAATV
jgi:hypothetical protein